MSRPLPRWGAALLVTGLTVAAPASHARAQADETTVVAVFPVRPRGIKLKPTLVEVLTEYVASRIASIPRYSVVPQTDLKEALRNKKAESYNQCIDDSCQIEIGKEVAAEQTVSTQILKIASTCAVSIAFYDLRQNASVFARTAEGSCREESLLRSIRTALAGLSDPSSTAVTPIPKTSPPDPETLPAESESLTEQPGPSDPTQSGPAAEAPPASGNSSFPTNRPGLGGLRGIFGVGVGGSGSIVFGGGFGSSDPQGGYQVYLHAGILLDKLELSVELSPAVDPFVDDFVGASQTLLFNTGYYAPIAGNNLFWVFRGGVGFLAGQVDSALLAVRLDVLSIGYKVGPIMLEFRFPSLRFYRDFDFGQNIFGGTISLGASFVTF